MTDFEALQAAHQELLIARERDGDGDALVQSALDYVARAQSAAEGIPEPRERDQLRANLRFWASFIFEQTGTYPDTTLRPAAAAREMPLPTEGALPVPPPIPPAAFDIHETRNGGGNFPRGLLVGCAVFLGITVLAGGALLLRGTLRREGSPSATPVTVDTPTTAPVAEATPTPIESSSVLTATPDAPTAVIPVTATAAPSTPVPLGELSLAGVVASAPSEPCARRFVEVSFDGVSVPPGTVVEIIRRRTGDIAATTRVGANASDVELDLTRFGVTTDEAFLLTVGHPTLPLSAVILQFDADCSRNRVDVNFTAPQSFQEAAATLADGDTLKLEVVLLSWGPSPSGLEWVAALELRASGGDGNYFYWADGVLLPENQLIVSGAPCEATRVAIGITSGGHSLPRTLFLQSPFCPAA